MFIAAGNLLQEVIYHRCIIVVSGWVVTKHCSQRIKGGVGDGGGGMQMTNRPMER